MKYARRKYAIFAITALLLVVLFFNPIARIFIILLKDEVYRYKQRCWGEFCVTIVSKSKLAINSQVSKYLYIGKGNYIPNFDNKYVMFGDGSEFCVKGNPDGSLNIYSTSLPIINNIGDRIKVFELEDGGEACTASTF